jgi:AraC-like DNA-binding protein
MPPTATGGIVRLAFARAAKHGADLRWLLRRSGLTAREVKDRHARIPTAMQIALLGMAAEALDDDLLGFHLAEDFDLRQIGLVYYVMASAPTLREAFANAGRYGAVTNEAVALTCSRTGDVRLRLDYVGVARYADRQQAEFWMTSLVRVARQLTSTRINPIRLTLVHPRCAESHLLETFFGCNIEFSAPADEIIFHARIGDTPLFSADPYLHKLLEEYCEVALGHRHRPIERLRTRVENAIVPLLPQGRPRVGSVAKTLGLSQRTLSRRLAAAGLTFERVLDEMRQDLAESYLNDERLSVSRVAWLLGYQDVSAFSHAYRRWTGRTPREARCCREHPNAVRADGCWTF